MFWVPIVFTLLFALAACGVAALAASIRVMPPRQPDISLFSRKAAMTRVPSIPRKPKTPDQALLDDVELILGGSEQERKEQQARFIRDELARIGNEIDGRKR